MGEESVRTSLADIAERVGVSKASVHAALGGSGRVSEETRQKIQQVADELGYRPHLLARGLRTKSTGMVALVGYNPWSLTSDLLGAALNDWAIEQGRYMVSAGTGGEAGRERELVEFFFDLEADALVVDTDAKSKNLDLFVKVAKQKPLVLIGDPDPDRQLAVSVVCTTGQDMGYCAGRHLLNCGRRRIAFLGLPEPIPWGTWTTTRRAGCELALREAGSLPLTLIPVEPYTGGDRYAYCEQAVLDFFTQGGTADALACANDYAAFAALGALHALGLRIPEDVAVIGVDDLAECRDSTPRLTSIRRPFIRLATEIGQLLTQLMEDGSRPFVHHFLAPELVVRASTVSMVEESLG